MALITKVGGRESNSYNTLTEIQSYIEALGLDYSAWEVAEEITQELCATLAAQAMMHFPWSGRRSYCGQALDFPRTSQDDVTQYPVEIKQAHAHIAFNVIFRGLQALAPIAEGTTQPDMSKVRQVSLGGLLSVSFDGNTGRGSGSILDTLTRSLQFPIYLSISRWVSQFRGGAVSDGTDEVSCSTTTTTTTTTTTSTSSTTTTT